MMMDEEAKEEIRDLWAALEESVKLQSHYAQLLNMHDGGQRKEFSDAHAWVDRLIDIGTLPVRRRKRVFFAFAKVTPEIVTVLTAASHALRSYQYGNSATDLAKEIADKCDDLIRRVGVPA
jgi:hypothetical protein